MTLGTADIRHHWVTCCCKPDAGYVAYVDAHVVVENAKCVDYEETDDDDGDERAASDCEIVNVVDEKETDDVPRVSADAMESTAEDVADDVGDDVVKDGVVEDGAVGNGVVEDGVVEDGVVGDDVGDGDVVGDGVVEDEVVEDGVVAVDVAAALDDHDVAVIK